MPSQQLACPGAAALGGFCTGGLGGGGSGQQVLEPLFQLFVSVTNKAQATVWSPWDNL